MQPFGLELLIRFTQCAQEFNATNLEPGKKGRVVRHTRLVGLGVPHPDNRREGFRSKALGAGRRLLRFIGHEFSGSSRDGSFPCSYQMVFTAEVLILPSRLMTGTPKCKAVAAIIRSGISGTSSRRTRPTARATLSVRSATCKTASRARNASSRRASVPGGILPFSCR